MPYLNHLMKENSDTPDIEILLTESQLPIYVSKVTSSSVLRFVRTIVEARSEFRPYLKGHAENVRKNDVLYTPPTHYKHFLWGHNANGETILILFMSLSISRDLIY